jgi:hypothetical protein
LRFVDAAIAVLKRAGRPMTTDEITETAIAHGLLAPTGKTPSLSMRSALYVEVRDNEVSPIVKLYEPGTQRARRKSVRWGLRSR